MFRLNHGKQQQGRMTTNDWHLWGRKISEGGYCTFIFSLARWGMYAGWVPLSIRPYNDKHTGGFGPLLSGSLCSTKLVSTNRQIFGQSEYAIPWHKLINYDPRLLGRRSKLVGSVELPSYAVRNCLRLLVKQDGRLWVQWFREWLISIGYEVDNGSSWCKMIKTASCDWITVLYLDIWCPCLTGYNRGYFMV